MILGDLTGDHATERGLMAAVLVARARHRSGRGPTFSELFDALIPSVDNGRLVPTWQALEASERQTIRYHAAIHWRRLGWLSWSRSERSLQCGPVFRDASRRRRAGYMREK